MVITRNYELFYDEDRDLYIVRSFEHQSCPVCGSALSGYDRRIRNSVSADGDSRRYLLRRLQCTKCSVLHIELLDLMLTQKHYDRAVIERARTDLADCPADDSTIRRWRK